jgi:hypothetical protein
VTPADRRVRAIQLLCAGVTVGFLIMAGVAHFHLGTFCGPN